MQLDTAFPRLPINAGKWAKDGARDLSSSQKLFLIQTVMQHSPHGPFALEETFVNSNQTSAGNGVLRKSSIIRWSPPSGKGRDYAKDSIWHDR